MKNKQEKAEQTAYALTLENGMQFTSTEPPRIYVPADAQQVANVSTEDVIARNIDMLQDGGEWVERTREVLKEHGLYIVTKEDKETLDRVTVLPSMLPIMSGDKIKWANNLLANVESGRTQPGVSATKQEVASRIAEDTLKMVVRSDSGEVFSVILDGASEFLKVDGKGRITNRGKSNTLKVCRFVLYQITSKGFDDNIYFSIQQLVDLGIYKNAKSAAKNLPDRLKDLRRLSFRIESKDEYGGKSIIDVPLVGAFKVDSKLVTLAPPVRNFPYKSLSGGYSAYYPNWIWGLSNNAHNLAYLIFTRARQNGGSKSFTVTIKYIMDNLGLPTVEEVAEKHHSKYAQKITEPIYKAIEELQEAVKKETEGGIPPLVIYGAEELSALEMKGGRAGAEDFVNNGSITVEIVGECRKKLAEISKKHELHQKERKKAARK